MLTDLRVRNAKSKEKTYRLADAGGLYLEVSSTGSKYWRMKYRHAGKEKRLALGVYPIVSLSDARAKATEAKARLREGTDPSALRKSEKTAAMVKAANTFEAVAREWHGKRAKSLSTGHAAQIINTLSREIFPVIGPRPVSEIEAPEILAALRQIEARDALEIAHKARQWCGMVFRYAIATGRTKNNPAADLRGALATPVERHYAAFDQAGLADFLRRLDSYEGNRQTQLALRLLALTFVRTGELRGAQWSEIDFDRHEWRIPAERMKMRAPHLVPLSRQAVTVLSGLQEMNGAGRLVFPSMTSREKPMSENTILYALYRMGYHGRATGHGFRATASTLLNEMAWRPDVIERQLAHKEGNKVRAAYHRSEYLPERRKMMQAWADYLDALKASADVIPLFKKA